MASSSSSVRAERGAVVVVAHHPDDLRAEALGHRLDDARAARVGVGLAVVGEVAGEDQRIGSSLGSLEPLKQLG